MSKDCREYPDISRWVPAFVGFTEFTASIPKMYWDVKSQEQRIKAICEQLHKLICYSDMLAGKINIDHDDILELQKLFQQFMESGFDAYYAEQVEKWIDEHLQFIYDHTIKQIYFGLTLDGYFVAYIPESWDDITFDTIMNYADPNYGCLTLSY